MISGRNPVLFQSLTQLYTLLFRCGRTSAVPGNQPFHVLPFRRFWLISIFCFQIVLDLADFFIHQINALDLAAESLCLIGHKSFLTAPENRLIHCLNLCHIAVVAAVILIKLRRIQFCPSRNHIGSPVFFALPVFIRQGSQQLFFVIHHICPLIGCCRPFLHGTARSPAAYCPRAHEAQAGLPRTRFRWIPSYPESKRLPGVSAPA